MMIMMLTEVMMMLKMLMNVVMGDEKYGDD
jgi:hypothetical protein